MCKDGTYYRETQFLLILENQIQNGHFSQYSNQSQESTDRKFQTEKTSDYSFQSL